MLSLAREDSRFHIISQVLVLVFLFIHLVFFLWGQNLFSCPPFFFHQLLSYAKSAFHVQLKLCNTHHSIYFILLVAVTTAAPDLSSYLCMVLCVCTHTHATLVYVSSSTDWIRATGYIFLITESAFLFSSYSERCLDRLFLDIHSISTSWLHLTLI